MMKNKRKLKLSSAILATVFVLMVLGVFASNIALKGTYDEIDKGDLYWNYDRVFEKPFKHIKIDGGNITKIIFEQNKQPSVRVLNSWREYEKGVTFTTFVKNDTLHLNFPNKYSTLNERDWMGRTILVRIFAPQLLSVEGNDTNFEIEKLQQPSININLKGKSSLEVESNNRNFDSLNISQADSSQVLFEMSPGTKGSKSMHFNTVTAKLKDYTILDIGHGYADKLNLAITDSSAVILSGKSLKAFKP